MPYDEALKAALDAMQANIMDANKTAVAALDTKIEAQTEALALTNAAVSAMVKKQVDDQMAGFPQEDDEGQDVRRSAGHAGRISGQPG